MGKRLVEACLAGLQTLHIPKCNLFLFAHHAAGKAFWQHNGWLDRSDLRVIQKVIGPIA